MKGEILIHEKEIAKKIDELAARISVDYKNQSFVVVSILKGANIFAADLQRAIYKTGCTQFRVSFIGIRTYVSGTQSSKQPKLVHGIDFDPAGKHILLLDDVIDSGISLKHVVGLLTEQRAASVKSCVLISKTSPRDVVYEPEYCGFTLPDVWLEGYGMDTNEHGRGNPHIIEGPSITLEES
jgi:hypoxanthine phosphoribosyltransferase